MKKIALILLLFTIASCAKTEDGEEHFDNAFLFENGCLKKDVMQGYAEDLPCLDPNNTGCVTREAWEAFHEVWRIHTPEPGISLCKQMRAFKF